MDAGVCRSLAYFRFISTQIYTGAVPFGICSTVMSILAVMEGHRPPRPTHPTFTGNLWKLMQHCWDQQPDLRPEASEVSQILLTMSVSHPFLQSYICRFTGFSRAVNTPSGGN